MTPPRRSFAATPLAALLALAGVLLLPLAVSGQAAATTGTVEGRVLNGDTGKFLGKALVTVVDSAVSTLTNDFGEYTLRNVPAGTVTLRFTHTGKAAQEVTLEIRPGASVVQNATLGGKGAPTDSTVVLDAFTVESVRFRNAADIAINEERYSVNIKNVVAADAFGDIAQGNIGEFVKFLPGVELDYGGTYTSPSDASGISVRGFGAADTIIYIDGVPISSASPASLSNAVGLDMMSINNASRVEIIKVPTPDMPSNSIGGQINLVSKSAFEYTKPTFSFRAYTTVNSENLDLFKRVAGPSNKKYYSSLPGADFTYAHPFSDSFGISITGSHYEEFTAQRRFRPEWGTANIGGVDLRAFGGAASANLTNSQGPVSLVNPYLTRISVTDSPRWQRRNSISLKADWKALPGLTLTGNYQYSIYDSADAARRLQFRIQRPQTWDAAGASSFPYLTAQQSVAQGGPNAVFNPNSTLDMNIDSRDKTGNTHTAYGRIVYQRGAWDIYAQASVSTSRGSFKDIENGHFSTVDVSSTVGRMTFANVADGVPGQVTVLTREGGPFNYSSLANWNVPTIQARSGKAESLNDIFTYRLDVRRELDFLPRRWVSLAAKAGVYRVDKLDKKWGLGTGWRQTYVGPALTVADYLDQTYTGNPPGWGLPAQEWISTYRLYDLYAKNPTFFNADSDSDQINNWNSTVNQNKRIREVSDAWYFQFEGKALRNRLGFIAGLRQEKAERTGRGPLTDNDWNFVKNADGTLYRNVALAGGNGLVAINSATSPLFATNTTGTALRSDLQSKGITFPTAPILSNTFAARQLQLLPLQEVRGESKGKPSYTIATSYDITSKIVGKLSYSRTFGRIDLENGTVGLLSASNAYTLNEADSSTAIPRGVITVANPNLKPWISDNWDASLVYYTDSGGKIGLTYFTKDVSNFQETFITTSTDPNFGVILDSLGLEASSYPDWELRTTLNGIGTSKTEGWELELSQDFRKLPFIGDIGQWGRRFYGFANYSSKKRKQANALLSARPAADDTASAGLQFATNRFSAMIKATWTDLKFISATNVTYNGTNYPLGTYAPSVTKVDANVNVQLTRRWSLFASARDIFNTGDVRKRFEINSGLYPAYAAWDDLREYGVSINVGVSGSF